MEGGRGQVRPTGRSRGQTLEIPSPPLSCQRAAEASDLEEELPVTVAVGRAASDSASARRRAAVCSGPEAAALPAVEMSSLAAAGSGLTDSGSVRSPASARSDLEVAVSPVAEMPVPPATVPERSGSDLAEPAARESALQGWSGFGLQNYVASCPTVSGSKASAAWQWRSAPGLPARTKLVRLSSGPELRFGGYVSYQFLLLTSRFADLSELTTLRGA